MADTIVLIIYQILWLVAAFFFYRLLGCLAVRKDGVIWLIVTFASEVIIISMVIFPNDMFNVTIALFWFLVLMLVGYRGKVIMKMAIVLILFPLIIAQNFLIAEILGVFCKMFGNGDTANNMCSIIDSVIHIGIWYILYKIVKKRVGEASKLFDDRTWGLLSIICVASLVSIITFIYFAPRDSYKVWLGALACMVTNVGALYLAGYFVSSIKISMERQNLKLRQNYYEELEKNQKEIRKIRHDMNHHLSTMRGLLEQNDRDGAGNYLKELENQMSARGREFCKNGIVNAVINTKYNQAIENSIDCFFHIQLPEQMFIDPVSLCSIFANTFDNALEASFQIKEKSNRHISVKARITKNGYFSYEIENRKCNKIVEKKGTIMTSKKMNNNDNVNHGMGLQNVRDIVEKYHGMMNVSYTEDTFLVVILVGGE